MMIAENPQANGAAGAIRPDRITEASPLRRLTAGWHTNDAVVDLEYTGSRLRDFLGPHPQGCESAFMGKIERIEVPPEDRERLDRNTPQKIVWRSQIVLLAGGGMGAVEVATRVGKSVLTVRRWRRRYAPKGVDGLLKDATRPMRRAP
jgi:hypothetical protein